jgi:YidC/Oxa1 family membrane protein insertase
MKCRSCLLGWIWILMAPCAPAQEQADATNILAGQSGLSISTVGGLPRFFADDIRLQWFVPGDAEATRRYRELEYVVVDAKTGDGLRRTFIARETIDERRLVHHYFLAGDGSLRSDGALRMDLDFPAGAVLELSGEPRFIPDPLPGFGAAYGDVRAVAVDAQGQRPLEVGADGRVEEILKPGDWFGIRNRFWTAILQSTAVPLTVEITEPQPNLPRLVSVIPQDVSRVTLELYAGPVEIGLLRAVDPMLTNMLFAALWDWLRALCFGLLWVLSIMHGFVGNIGLAVILLSVCVKILMSPLTLVAERWQDSVNQTVATLQPQIDAIKKEYKGEEAHNRILEVYKEHDVHPMYPVRSLAGFLIQIPVFIAAFDMLGENFLLHHASFLWIGDLAKPDRWLALPWALPFFGGHLNLLPFLMTGITILTSWIQTDPSLTPELLHRQRLRLYLMAVAFFILFYTFPAGMVLYWTTNNVLHLAKIQLGRAIARFR